MRTLETGIELCFNSESVLRQSGIGRRTRIKASGTPEALLLGGKLRIHQGQELNGSDSHLVQRRGLSVVQGAGHLNEIMAQNFA